MKNLLSYTAAALLAGLIASPAASDQNTYPWPQNGSVGIGTPTPNRKLEVKDGEAGLMNAIIKLSHNGSTTNGTGELIESGLGVLFGAVQEVSGFPSQAFEVRGATSGLQLWVGTEGTLKNRLGIRTATPNATLHIVPDPGILPLQIDGGEAVTFYDLSVSPPLTYTTLKKVGSGGNEGSIAFPSSSRTYYIGTDNDNGGHLTLWATNGSLVTGSLVLQADGNVAIGAPGATEKLEVKGKIKATQGFQTDASVAIGTATPISKMTIGGDGVLISLVHPQPYHVINQPKLISAPEYDTAFGAYEQGSSHGFHVRTPAGPDVKLFVGTAGPYDGNVGIGTTTPMNKLEVNGTVKAKEVVVTLDGWSDYVFEDSYNLVPLSELEQVITAGKHLPGVPSGNEVKEQGVSVGQMQATLLRKIEELTLYVIELDKENRSLRQRVATLEQK